MEDKNSFKEKKKKEGQVEIENLNNSPKRKGQWK